MTAAKNLKPWKPGQSGNPSGRPKKLFPRVEQILQEQGKEPIQELLKLLPKLKDRDQAQLWLEILPYVHAKVKPADDGEPDELESLPTSELIKLVKEGVKDL